MDVVKCLTSALEPWLERSFTVAFSGGVDSTVLLHAMALLREANSIGCLEAIHINHGLSDNALIWQEHCQYFCDLMSVKLKVVSVHVSEADGEGLEHAARVARYQAFRNELNAGVCLLQGHHLNDQAETLLFRLFRGTGADGLVGMPKCRALGEAILLRPFLSISRREIEDYTSEYKLSYIEDESNNNQRFSRNYLRHSILPAIEKRWPNVCVRLSALANELAVANDQLNDFISELAFSVIQIHSQWGLVNQPLVNIAGLTAFKLETQYKVLRFWLKSQGYPVPGREVLGIIITDVINSRIDASPLLCWPGVEIRRYQGLLYASRSKANKQSVAPIKGVFWHWSQQPDFHCHGLGSLHVNKIDKQGEKAIAFPSNLIEIRTREAIDSSLKVSVDGRAGRKTLKRWLQSFNVPPWLRGKIPFLFFEDNMVAAPGLWVCSDFVAKGEGYCVLWRRE